MLLQILRSLRRPRGAASIQLMKSSFYVSHQGFKLKLFRLCFLWSCKTWESWIAAAAAAAAAAADKLHERKARKRFFEDASAVFPLVMCACVPNPEGRQEIFLLFSFLIVSTFVSWTHVKSLKNFPQLLQFQLESLLPKRVSSMSEMVSAVLMRAVVVLGCGIIVLAYQLRCLTQKATLQGLL